MNLIAFGFTVLAVEGVIFCYDDDRADIRGIGCTGDRFDDAGGFTARDVAGGYRVWHQFGDHHHVAFKPLRHLQGKRAPPDKSSDFIGLEFVMEQAIKLRAPGKLLFRCRLAH